MITIKEICGYLPYGLKMVRANKNIADDIFVAYGATDMAVFSGHFGIGVIGYERIKPLLRPLSSLTTEQEINGEMVVPIVLLMDIVELEIYGDYDSTNSFIECYADGNCFGIITGDENDNEVRFMVTSDLSFSFQVADKTCHFNHFKLIQKLYEWQFDIHDLISRGDAINILTQTK